MAKQSLAIGAVLVALAAAGLPVLAQRTIYIAGDVPTNPDGPPTYLPWQVVRHAHLAAVPYSLELTLPGNPAIDGLHKLDAPNNWLVSFESATSLAGLLVPDAEPRDVVRWNAGLPSPFFTGGCVSPPVPPTSNLDALYLAGTLGGDLIVGFDVPTTLGVTTFQPSQLVRFKPSGVGPCAWTLVGLELDVTFGTYFPASTNITGVARAGTEWILALDIPADVGPPAGPTRTPGQIVTTDGVTWNHFFDDLQAEGTPGWPITSVVDALACEANPGRIDSPLFQITLGKSLPNITIFCPGSCSSGAVRYGIYRGTIASLLAGSYNHVQQSCGNLCPGGLTFAAPAGSTYYLVVPHNFKEEGSYGLRSTPAERPQPVLMGDRCVAPQNLTPCP